MLSDNILTSACVSAAVLRWSSGVTEPHIPVYHPQCSVEQNIVWEIIVVVLILPYLTLPYLTGMALPLSAEAFGPVDPMRVPELTLRLLETWSL